jgi:hypothetical protein
MTQIKPEITLEIDSFENTKQESPLQSVILRIVNLLHQEKGTVPGKYDMGIAAGNYLFEIINNSLLNNLSNQVTTQISLYLPDVPLGSVNVSQGTGVDKKAIFILVTFSEAIENVKRVNFKIEGNGSSIPDITALI